MFSDSHKFFIWHLCLLLQIYDHLHILCFKDILPGITFCRHTCIKVFMIAALQDIICMYVNAHRYMHIYICTYIHTQIHACLPTSIHPYINRDSYMPAEMHAYMYTLMHVCLHTYTHRYMHRDLNT